MNKQNQQITDELSELGSDILEMGIDGFLSQLKDNPELLSDVPVVKTVISFHKLQASVREKFLYKKFNNFIKVVNDATITAEELLNFRTRLEDEKTKEKFNEYIFHSIEQMEDEIKATVLGNLTANFIKGQLDYEELLLLISVLNRSQVVAFNYLYQSSKVGFGSKSTKNDNPEEETFLISAGIGYRVGEDFSITDTGIKFYEFGVKMLYPN